MSSHTRPPSLLLGAVATFGGYLAWTAMSVLTVREFGLAAFGVLAAIATSSQAAAVPVAGWLRGRFGERRLAVAFGAGIASGRLLGAAAFLAGMPLGAVLAGEVLRRCLQAPASAVVMRVARRAHGVDGIRRLLTWKTFGAAGGAVAAGVIGELSTPAVLAGAAAFGGVLRALLPLVYSRHVTAEMESQPVASGSRRRWTWPQTRPVVWFGASYALVAAVPTLAIGVIEQEHGTGSVAAFAVAGVALPFVLRRLPDVTTAAVWPRAAAVVSVLFAAVGLWMPGLLIASAAAGTGRTWLAAAAGNTLDDLGPTHITWSHAAREVSLGATVAGLALLTEHAGWHAAVVTAAALAAAVSVTGWALMRSDRATCHG